MVVKAPAPVGAKCGSKTSSNAVFVVVAIMSLVAGCSVEPQRPAVDAPEMRIAVFSSGQIEVDGDAVDLAGLESRLEALEATGGTVIYYRESPSDSEPHPVVSDVMDAIVKLKLPVSFSTEPDFSTVLDLRDGTVKPRK